MLKGFQNEIDFIRYFNHKQIKDLSLNAQTLILTLYKDANINDKIQCWKSKYLEKSDIKLKINGNIKGISIKTGNECSMHQENIFQFCEFLAKLGVEDSVINDLIDFMKGEINKRRVSAQEYKQTFPIKLKKIEIALNTYYVKANLIIRFIFIGTELQKYGCSALIHGTPNNFLWATADEIMKYMLKAPTINKVTLPIGLLSLKCYDRNLRNNPERIKGQNDIQVKWYTIVKDFTAITEIRKKGLVIK